MAGLRLGYVLTENPEVVSSIGVLGIFSQVTMGY